MSHSTSSCKRMWIIQKRVFELRSNRSFADTVPKTANKNEGIANISVGPTNAASTITDRFENQRIRDLADRSGPEYEKYDSGSLTKSDDRHNASHLCSSSDVVPSFLVSFSPLFCRCTTFPSAARKVSRTFPSAEKELTIPPRRARTNCEKFPSACTAKVFV